MSANPRRSRLSESMVATRLRLRDDAFDALLPGLLLPAMDRCCWTGGGGGLAVVVVVVVVVIGFLDLCATTRTNGIQFSAKALCEINFGEGKMSPRGTDPWQGSLAEQFRCPGMPRGTNRAIRRRMALNKHIEEKMKFES